MKKQWITGLTVVGIAGSAGAAVATSAAHQSPSAKAEGLDPQAEVVTTARAVTYQVGQAGDVNLNVSGDVLGVTSVLPSSGWSVVGWTPQGGSVSVQFTDTMQVVTFTASIENGQITTVITNAPAAAETTTDPSTTQGTPAPQPAVPVIVLNPSGTPSNAHTSSPSKSGGEQEDDDESYDDSHESEDHEEFGDD